MINGLVKSWTRGGLRVHLFRSSDIVTKNPNNCAALLNPSNGGLVGAQLSYIAIGLPPPPSENLAWEASSSWGGMEVGANMLYRAEAVDGQVTSWGGKALRAECQEIVSRLPGQWLQPGNAVLTNGGGLKHIYRHIVHTNPPFHNEANWEVSLGACYHAALEQLRHHKLTSIATPILGTGQRGIDLREGARVTARALRTSPDLGEMTVSIVTITAESTKVAEAALDAEFA
jgi:O-acetyl-ADP-ribose deacetylase (regulator of RNase III)